MKNAPLNRAGEDLFLGWNDTTQPRSKPRQVMLRARARAKYGPGGTGPAALGPPAPPTAAPKAGAGPEWVPSGSGQTPGPAPPLGEVLVTVKIRERLQGLQTPPSPRPEAA